MAREDASDDKIGTCLSLVGEVDKAVVDKLIADLATARDRAIVVELITEGGDPDLARRTAMEIEQGLGCGLDLRAHSDLAGRHFDLAFNETHTPAHIPSSSANEPPLSSVISFEAGPNVRAGGNDISSTAESAAT